MKLTRKRFDEMKFGLSQLKHRTPTRMKKLGDALLATFGAPGVGLTAFQAMSEQPNKTYLIAGIVFGGLGLLGKFLSIFFGEDEIESEEIKPNA